MSADPWQDKLSPEVYRVTRQCGTEPPFSGRYVHHHADGHYLCACCGVTLFGSEKKFDSGSGWPSFWAGVSDAAIRRIRDTSHGMIRVEIRCAACDAHLGHVFPDGPHPTGERFCVNSLSLRFQAGGSDTTTFNEDDA